MSTYHDDGDSGDENSDDDDGQDYDNEKKITNTSFASTEPRPGNSSSFDLIEGISILPQD
ncbi:hypothetical protein F3G63_34005 [Pseudomonas aeruginosa]|nr:hypothetical protein F3G63_34005 [Pseudomonas aeruginosa]TLM46158.1 hypothetical protein FEC35_18915 [Acinetobacter baumannii]